jgi:hypothetical protein
MIEALESRTLLSASSVIRADLAVIRAQASVVRTDVSTFQKIAAADITLIKNDLNRLGTLKTDRSLLNGLLKQEHPDLVQLKKEAATLISGGTAAINRVVADFNRLQKHPGNTTSQAKLSADSTLLQNAIAAAQQAVSARSSLVINDGTIGLDAIGGANSSDPETQNDVATAKTDLGTNVQIVASGVTLLLTDVSNLLNAFSA